MSINYELLDLRAFVAVVDLVGFHRAATSLNMSQPALSRRIQRLELAIGEILLERTTRRIALTTAGRAFLPMVRRMLDEFDHSLFSMQDRGRSSAVVTLACIPTAAFYFLPSVIGRFKAKYPAVRFRISDMSANNVIEAVLRGDVEFGISLFGSHHSELTFEPLLEEEFVFACRRDHPLAEREELQWSDLEGYPLITVSRSSGNRLLLDGALVKAGLNLAWSFEVNHLSTSLGLVEAGLGVSVLPRLATPQLPHPILVTRKISNPTVSRTLGILRRQGLTLPPATQQFVTQLLGTWAG
jgi:DNA-binding transcriptional LysR family regulator